MDTRTAKLVEPYGPESKGTMPMGNFTATSKRRTIKLSRSAPHLVVAVPVGSRAQDIISTCPKCQSTYVGNSELYPGLIPAELLTNYASIAFPLGVAMSLMVKKDGLPAENREKLTEQALESGANFVFFWDDDVILPSDVLYKMLAKMGRYPDIGVISGVYYTKARPQEPVVYKNAGEGAWWGFNRDPEAEPEDIFAAGAGCMMVRVDALRKMKRPYWSDARSIGPDGYVLVSGHDFGFCRKVWEETDMRVTVDGSITCGHLDVNSQTIFLEPVDAGTMAVVGEGKSDTAPEPVPPVRLRFDPSEILKGM